MILPFLSALLAPQDDSELIRLLKRRDTQAMGELYDRFGKLVYAIVIRIVRDPPVAEDLVQETFLKIWNRIAGFDPEWGALEPWVLTIARNHAINYRRSTEGRLSQARCNLERLERPGLFVGFDADVADRAQARFLRQAFDKLSDNQRRVLDLAYFEGLSETEIATRLRHPAGTVKAWACSALQAVRKELKQASRDRYSP
jgi:RNA polymerase sigma-70 factor (ECF subfamily)